MAALAAARKLPSALSPLVVRVSACGPLCVEPRRSKAIYHHSLVPKGTGGRSSFSGVVAAVFGGNGFLGRYVVSRLGREGSQIVLPHRCDPYWVMPIKLMGDLGQVMFRQYELRDHDLIRDIVSHCNVVINLLGKDFETRHYTFEDVNIEGPRNLARICKEAGVPRLIHVSALGADLASPSKFLRTKAAGEKVVREQFPEAIIIRPAQMFGREDRFFNHFANQRFFGGVPLYPSARKVVKRPVYVADVAQAIMTLTREKDVDGKLYELAGPKGYHLTELVDFLYRVTRRPYVRYYVPRPILRLVARGFELSPFDPFLTRDMLELQHTTDVLQAGVPGLEDLGVTPTTVEYGAIRGLRRHRADRYFDLGIDEVQPAPTVN
ncbi:NADH dehydrogenase [ubiquinone] 1 alpha subcomplex subunit 9, mitochondrial-like [Diadema antillarum]|uniref:NADH dehydrogenase [ubiquinone] 1 alpha subcomplex subunit 9, mitochondrial-like n=1 Tax=Diadema antillarum TaxID=105358 RepID=UPI003A8BB057